MSDIKTCLTSNIDEVLKVDGSLFTKCSPDIPGTSGSIRKAHSRESLQNKSDHDSEGSNSSDRNKKKRFGNFKKVIKGNKGDKKNKKNDDGKPIDMYGDSPIGKLNHTESYQLPGKKKNTSAFSRMWNSIFPSRDSQIGYSGETMMKERSSKTLGRLFGIKTNKVPIEDDLAYRPKSSTLGRRLTHGLGFRHNSSKIKTLVTDDKTTPTITTTNLVQNQSAPIPI